MSRKVGIRARVRAVGWRGRTRDVRRVWPAHTWKGVFRVYVIAQYAKALQKPRHSERRKMANQTPRRLIPALSCHTYASTQVGKQVSEFWYVLRRPELEMLCLTVQ